MSQPAFEPIANPYVGPRTFSEAERGLFFGREREARDLTARIVSERLLLFYAQSGAGKSSLLNTRVIPALRDEEGFQVLPVGRVSGELPAGVDATTNLYAFSLMTSLDQSGEPPARLAGLTLSEFLARLAGETATAEDGRRTRRWVYKPELAAARPTETEQPTAARAGPRFALVIDQFEEIITSHPGRWEQREEFFRQLNQALLDDPNLWVVLTLREDYVAALDPYASLLFNRLRARFYMERMGADAALDAIRRPAELGGRPFAPAVAERLAEDLRQVRVLGQRDTISGQYVEPVQLQVVCFQLWDNIKGRPPGPITAQDLAEAGDVNQALSRFYEKTLQDVLADPASRVVSERQLRAWFDNELITEAGTRGLVRQAEQETGGLPNAAVRGLQSRFLVRAETRSGDTWIELVHDRLIAPVQADNAAWFAANLSTLQRQAALWEEQRRPDGLLLRGGELVKAEQWATEHQPELEPHEVQFLAACQAARAAAERERRQSRRIRSLAVVVGIFAIAAMVAAGLAWWQRSVAQNEAMVRSTAQANEAGARREAETRQAEAQTAATAEAAARGQAERSASAEATAAAVAREKQAEAERETLRSRRALATQLAAQAQSALAAGGKEVTGLLLATEALNITERAKDPLTFAAIQALWDGLARLGGRGFADHDGRYGSDRAWGMRTLGISQNGQWLLTVNDRTRTISLWDLRRPDLGAQHIDLPDDESPYNLSILSEDHGPGGHSSLSSDGRWLMAGRRLWDLTVSDPAAHPIELGERLADISPDGRWLAGAGERGQIRVWDLTRPPVIGESQVLTICTSSDDLPHFVAPNWLAATDMSGSPLIWNVAEPASTPLRLNLPEGHSPLAVSADARWLVTGNSYFGPIQLWGLGSGVPLTTSVVLAPSGEAPPRVAPVVSIDRRWVAEPAEDGIVRLWDLLADDPVASVQTLTGLTGAVASLAISADGHWLVTGHYDPPVQVLRVWDLTQDRLTAPVSITKIEESEYGPSVEVLGIDSDSHRVLLADSHRSLGASAQLWAWTQPEYMNLRGLDAGDSSYAVGQDGRWLASIGPHNVRSGRVLDLARPEPDAAIPTLIKPWSYGSIAITPDSRWLIAQEWNSGLLWDLNQIDSHPVPVTWPNTAVPISVTALSPDYRWIVAVDQQGTGYRWDLAATSPAAEPLNLSDREAARHGQSISPDGRWLVTEDSSRVRLWDINRQNQRRDPIDLLSDEVPNAVTFSQNSRWLIILARPPRENALKVHLWDLAATAGAPVPVTLPAHIYDVGSSTLKPALAISPDGRWLAVGQADNTVQLWDLTAPDPLATGPRVLHGHKGSQLDGDGVFLLAFSPDGHWLATRSYELDNRAIRLWDLTVDDPNRHMRILTGLEPFILDMAFSPDNHWLATQSRSMPTASGLENKATRAMLWDLTAETPETAFAALPVGGGEGRVTVSPDGRWLVTSLGGEIQLWPLQTEDLLALACQVAGRNLDEDEWEQYFQGQPYRKTCLSLPVNPNYMAYTLDTAASQVQAGELDGALTLLGNPELGLDPRRAVADLLVDKGYGRAISDPAGALTDLQAAFALDPASLAHPPEVELNLLQAERLAGVGKFDEAKAIFEKALARDPSALGPDLQKQLTALVARGLIARGQNLTYSDVAAATAAFAEAQVLNPLDGITTRDWYALCLQGGLTQHADIVVKACDAAVSMAPCDAEIRDSRGLVRALAGDFAGAIEDFRFFIENTGTSDSVDRRNLHAGWISQLETGVNPFASATQEELRQYFVVDGNDDDD